MRIPAHIVSPFTGGLLLTVRAFSGLLDQGSQTEEVRVKLSHTDQLRNIIQLLPGSAEQRTFGLCCYSLFPTSTRGVGT